MLEFAGLGIVVAGALVALSATGAFSGIANGVSNATCTVTGTCEPDQPQQPGNDDIACVRAPCPGPGSPSQSAGPSQLPTQPIECVRAPCGPQPDPPKPRTTPSETIFCVRAPCP